MGGGGGGEGQTTTILQYDGDYHLQPASVRNTFLRKNKKEPLLYIILLYII